MSVIQTLQAHLASYGDCRRWLVAYSGGLDSTVLLHALAQLESRPPLCALHIHHGLQPDADAWQAHCEATCAALGLVCHSLRVQVEPDGDGPEAAARRARYRAFEDFLQPGDLLLQAHHLDDQIETRLLRLLRGTGVEGFRGIPDYRPLGQAALLRPLLTLPRPELEAYAREQALNWIEDPSNADTRFDRNYLRQRVLPLIAERWPAYRQALQRFSGHLAEGQVLPVADVQRQADSPRPVIDLDALRALDEAGRNRALRHWLAPRVPSAAQLREIQRSLLWSAVDAEPVFELGDLQLRRFRDRLYQTELGAFDPDFIADWDFQAPLVIPGAGVLRAERCERGGLAASRVRVSLRRGGERCRPAGRAHSQTLKKLLQDYDVPPWLRDRLPLIYSEAGELAAVADLWVCEGFNGPGGWRLCWQQP